VVEEGELGVELLVDQAEVFDGHEVRPEPGGDDQLIEGLAATDNQTDVREALNRAKYRGEMATPRVTIPLVQRVDDQQRSPSGLPSEVLEALEQP
jgi:hypothetical protein